MSSLVMPSGFVDMNGIEMEYDGGFNWNQLAIASVALTVVGLGLTFTGFGLLAANVEATWAIRAAGAALGIGLAAFSSGSVLTALNP